MPTYSASSIWRAIVIATTVAGTLDILGAFVFSILAGGTPLGVLRGIGGAVVDPETVAAWPQVARVGVEPVLAAIGLALHFAIMTAMAIVYVIAAARVGLVNRLAMLSGVGYGIVVWAIMYWVVLPRRWPTLFPVAEPRQIAEQLFCHIVLVGIPIALVTKSARRWQ